jgi:hypothetical protein
LLPKGVFFHLESVPVVTRRVNPTLGTATHRAGTRIAGRTPHAISWQCFEMG